MKLESACLQPMATLSKTLRRAVLLKSGSAVLPHSPLIDSSCHSKHKDWLNGGWEGRIVCDSIWEGRIVYDAAKRYIIVCAAFKITRQLLLIV